MVTANPRSASAHFSAPLVWLALVAALTLTLGCSALHRDIEEWDVGEADAHHDTGDNQEIPDDTGPGEPPEDTDPACVPGGACGPCDLGVITCDGDQEICEGAVDLQSDPDHCGSCENACDTGSEDIDSVTCQLGQCQVSCVEGDQTYCPTVDACVDLTADPDHCGSCDNACDTDNEDIHAVACEQSQCVVDCVDEDETYCPTVNACVDLQSDRNHCGACGVSCPGQQSCCSGNCTGGSC